MILLVAIYQANNTIVFQRIIEWSRIMMMKIVPFLAPFYERLHSLWFCACKRYILISVGFIDIPRYNSLYQPSDNNNRSNSKQLSLTFTQTPGHLKKTKCDFDTNGFHSQRVKLHSDRTVNGLNYTLHHLKPNESNVLVVAKNRNWKKIERDNRFRNSCRWLWTWWWNETYVWRLDGESETFESCNSFWTHQVWMFLCLISCLLLDSNAFEWRDYIGHLP